MSAPASSTGPAETLPRRDVQTLHFTITQAIGNTYSVWLVSLFITVPAWGHAPVWLWLGWLAMVGLAYTARARLLQPGFDLALVQATPLAWTRRLNGSTLGCSAVAALGPSLFYPSLSDIARMYICMLFCCWLAGSMASLGARPRLFALYAAVFTGGLGVAWLRTDSAYVTPILLMLFVYALVLAGFARSFARQVNESVEIRFINQGLVEQLTQAREAAEKSSAAKSRFLAVASHDLRQPLHAVTLLNGMLARPQPPDRIEEISRQMARSLDTLERLFSSVLDFSKIEADKVKPAFVWYPLERLMEQLVHDYAPQAARKGLSFKVRGAAVLLYTDPQLLERILRNLVDNAIKFTERGCVEVQAWQEPGVGLILRVNDSGPGIPHNLRENIFNEYYQAPGDKASAGLGLGLAIVRRLAGLLELTVVVEDGEPHGASFKIEVQPAKVRQLPGGDSAQAERDTAPVDLTDYFVVYVEDDAFSREALGLLLSDWGCRSLIAENLNDALNQLEGKGVPDVILSDYSLGDGATGTSVIEEMRRRYGPVAGAILTGESSAIQMRLAGDLEYPVLGKPVTAHDLRSLLVVFKGIG